MPAREQTRITPHSVEDLCFLLAKLHGEADGIVERYEDDEAYVDSFELGFEKGRRRAYDVALYWASELRRVQERPT